ncbi:sensor histidine kinase [Heliobacterium mobile]|uniref:sensor histidine kinase n=1 Tax=Heliobacterium mobile TaxID=28064 RepID=UPI001478D578|nr:ATP-binding protein [Heliobacterium mobile]
MFTRTRTRLTIIYTGLMIVFLLLFTVITYMALSSMLYQEEKQELLSLLTGITSEQTKEMKKRHIFGSLGFPPYKNEEDHKDHYGKSRRDMAVVPPTEKYDDESSVSVATDDNTQMDDFIEADDPDRSKFLFYLLTDEKGSSIRSREVLPSIQPVVMEQIRDWVPTKTETKLVSVPGMRDQEFQLLIAVQPLYEGNRFIGAAYAGFDVTSSHHVLQRLLFVLGVLSLLSLFFAAGAAYYMAGRAMVPIVQSFTRQREFVADASHELRTPLSVLHSSIEVIEADDSRNLSEFSQQVLSDMKDEVRRMTRLVSDLLTLARADSGNLELLRENFDLRALIDQILRTFQHQATSKGVAMDFKGLSTISIWGDRERITQLLFILVDNAVKYTPTGGHVTLALELVKQVKGQQVRVTVQDTGIGIPEEAQTRIFDRFYRVDKGRSRQMGGTGLGLSIARWIVEAHGGTIQVESTAGSGSIFSASLPLQEEKGNQKGTQQDLLHRETH